MGEKCDICGKETELPVYYILLGNIYQVSYDDMERVVKMCPRCFWFGHIPLKALRWMGYEVEEAEG